MIYQVQGFTFKELNNKAKLKVINWLDEFPIDYEDEEGQIHYRYFSELEEIDIEDHCDVNGYIFNTYGEPIHHIIEAAKQKKYQVFCDIGNNQWQVIGIEDYFYSSYEDAKKSLQDTLDSFGEDPNHYKIMEVLA